MTAEDFKKANDIISLYVVEYKKKFKQNPVVNRIKLKFMIADILQDLSVTKLKDLIKYYIKIETQPDLTSFCYEYDELLLAKKTEEEDKKARSALMSDTQRRVLEFRERYGK